MELGFTQCPFDPCAFSLVSRDRKGKAKAHGVLGIHVDDGLAGGDNYFSTKIGELNRIFPFGSQKEVDFVFTGIHMKQEIDGSICLDQQEYVEKMESIHVCRDRRRNPMAETTDAEKQLLRGLNGSLQYAAVHTRPDLSARVGYLQSMINRSTVSTLLEANRFLHEAKKTSMVYLFILSLPEDQNTFCAFSDA